MGRQVTVKLICDVCKNEVDETTSIPGELAGNRRRYTLQLHRGCFDSLVKSADVVARKARRRGRPRGSKNRPKAAASV